MLIQKLKQQGELVCCFTNASSQTGIEQ